MDGVVNETTAQRGLSRECLTPKHNFANPSAGNQEVLKVIAIVLMLLDHIAWVGGGDNSHPLHWLGRSVLPLLSYLLVFNYLNNTRNQVAYIKRLMIFALISQLPYMFAFEYGALVLNIFFTLGIGLLLIYSYEQFLPSPKKHLLQFIFVMVPMVYLFAFSSVFLSYGPFGLISIFAFYLYFKRPNTFSLVILAAAIFALNWGVWSPFVAMFGVLSLPIIALVVRYRLEVRRTNRWVYYLFYPTHLVAIKLAFIAA